MPQGTGLIPLRGPGHCDQGTTTKSPEDKIRFYVRGIIVGGVARRRRQWALSTRYAGRAGVCPGARPCRSLDLTLPIVPVGDDGSDGEACQTARHDSATTDSWEVYAAKAAHCDSCTTHSSAARREARGEPGVDEGRRLLVGAARAVAEELGGVGEEELRRRRRQEADGRGGALFLAGSCRRGGAA